MGQIKELQTPRSSLEVDRVGTALISRLKGGTGFERIETFGD